MADVEPTPDVGTPEGARLWFESVGVPYPQDKEEELLRVLPAHIAKSDKMEPKQRNNYLDYVRRFYSREPLLIPSRYRTKALLERGVPLDQIRAMQVKPLLSQKGLQQTIGALIEPLAGGITAKPDPSEDIDAYSWDKNIIPLRNNPLKAGARLDHAPSFPEEAMRRTVEDMTGKPVDYADIVKGAMDLVAPVVGPTVNFANLSTPPERMISAIREDLSAVDPRNLASVAAERQRGQPPPPTLDQISMRAAKNFASTVKERVKALLTNPAPSPSATQQTTQAGEE